VRVHQTLAMKRVKAFYKANVGHADQLVPRSKAVRVGDKNVLSKNWFTWNDIIRYFGFVHEITSLGGWQVPDRLWHRDCA